MYLNTDNHMMFCAIWYSFIQLKKRENTHEGVLLLVKKFCSLLLSPILPFLPYTVNISIIVSHVKALHAGQGLLQNIILGIDSLRFVAGCQYSWSPEEAVSSQVGCCQTTLIWGPLAKPRKQQQVQGFQGLKMECSRLLRPFIIIYKEFIFFTRTTPKLHSRKIDLI